MGRDLACGGVDGLDDLAAAGSDETDGAGGIVDHDGDDDAWLSRRRAIEDPHSAYFVDTVVKGDGAIAVDAQGPSKDGGVEGGGDGDVGGGDFEVADFSVGEGGWHRGSFSESLLEVSGWAAADSGPIAVIDQVPRSDLSSVLSDYPSSSLQRAAREGHLPVWARFH